MKDWWLWPISYHLMWRVETESVLLLWMSQESFHKWSRLWLNKELASITIMYFSLKLFRASACVYWNGGRPLVHIFSCQPNISCISLVLPYNLFVLILMLFLYFFLIYFIYFSDLFINIMQCGWNSRFFRAGTYNSGRVKAVQTARTKNGRQLICLRDMEIMNNMLRLIVLNLSCKSAVKVSEFRWYLTSFFQLVLVFLTLWASGYFQGNFTIYF